MTDLDLHSTLLFDSLVDPERAGMPLAGPDSELLGSALAEPVAELNRRVLVTGQPAETEVDVEINGPMTVLIAAEPVYGDASTVVGVVGSVVERSAKRIRSDVAAQPAPAERRR